MNKTFIDKQVIEAKDNFNYFFMKMIVKILQSCFKLAIVLLLDEIFNYTIVNIICIIYAIYTMYSIYNIVRKYNSIMIDIKDTLKYENISYVIDFNMISNNLFRGVVNYGK